MASDSSVDLSGKKLDDDDMVLGGSGSGSDITIGGDSGISLVDPADSGLSLEEPLNLGAGEESLELGEDDMLTFSADTFSSPSIKTDDDFQLTPMPESEGDDSESGSQVIALDTEGEGDEGVTMIGSGGSMAAMLDEDLGGEPSLGLAAPMPMTAGGPVEMTLAAPGGFAAGAADDATRRRLARGPLLRLEHPQPRPLFAVVGVCRRDDLRPHGAPAELRQPALRQQRRARLVLELV